MTTLDSLLQQALPKTRDWLPDAVANKKSRAGDDISEAADDFVGYNGKGSHVLANEILVALGEEPVFAQNYRKS